VLTESLAVELHRTLLSHATANSEARRATNQFFLALHAAAFAALGYASQTPASPRLAVVTTVLAGMMIFFCLVWLSALGYYKRLAAAKFAVIDEIETHLPIQPMRMEWEAMARRGLTVTDLERLVPLMFVIGFAIIAAEPWLAFIKSAVQGLEISWPWAAN